jgi:hypothetical protein
MSNIQKLMFNFILAFSRLNSLKEKVVKIKHEQDINIYEIIES